jgi:leucine dehydrogenase
VQLLAVRERHGRVLRAVQDEDRHRQPRGDLRGGDAVGAQRVLLTDELVPRLRCRSVVGPANNQLASDQVADLQAEHGVLWAPDYLVNAGGVVSGFHLELGSRDPEVARTAVTAIGATLRDVYDRADADGVTPLAAASAVARDRIASVTRQP